MTRNELTALYNECVNECVAADIKLGNVTDLSVKTKATRAWGVCKRTGKNFSIELSPVLLLDTTPRSATKETILHELCHTVEDGMNHTRGWKVAVNKLNRKYGYHITRCASDEDKGVDINEVPMEMRRKVNYSFKCTKCGQKVEYTRCSKFVKHYDLYRCGLCGGSFIPLSGITSYSF